MSRRYDSGYEGVHPYAVFTRSYNPGFPSQPTKPKVYLDTSLCNDLTLLGGLGELVIEDLSDQNHTEVRFFVGDSDTRAIALNVMTKFAGKLEAFFKLHQITKEDCGNSVVFIISRPYSSIQNTFLKELRNTQSNVRAAVALLRYLRDQEYRKCLQDYPLTVFQNALETLKKKHDAILMQMYCRRLMKQIVLAVKDCADRLSLSKAAVIGAIPVIDEVQLVNEAQAVNEEQIASQEQTTDAAEAAEIGVLVDYDAVIKLLISFGVAICDAWPHDAEIALALMSVLSLDADYTAQEKLTFMMNHSELLSDEAGVRIFAENYEKRHYLWFPTVGTSRISLYGRLTPLILAHKNNNLINPDDTFALLAYPVDLQHPSSPFIISLQMQIIDAYAQPKINTDTVTSILARWTAIQKIIKVQETLSNEIEKTNFTPLCQYFLTLNKRLLEVFDTDPDSSPIEFWCARAEEIDIGIQQCALLRDFIVGLQQKRQELEAECQQAIDIDEDNKTPKMHFTSASVQLLEQVITSLYELEYTDEVVKQTLEDLRLWNAARHTFKQNGASIERALSELSSDSILGKARTKTLILSLIDKAARPLRHLSTAKSYDATVMLPFKRNEGPIYKYFYYDLRSIASWVKEIEIISNTLQDLFEYLVQYNTLPVGAYNLTTRLRWLENKFPSNDWQESIASLHMLDEVAESICHDSGCDFDAKKLHFSRQIVLARMAMRAHDFINKYPENQCVSLWKMLHPGQSTESVEAFLSIEIGSYITLLLAAENTSSIPDADTDSFFGDLFYRVLSQHRWPRPYNVIDVATTIISQYSAIDLAKVHGDSLRTIIESARKNFPVEQSQNWLVRFFSQPPPPVKALESDDYVRIIDYINSKVAAVIDSASQSAGQIVSSAESAVATATEQAAFAEETGNTITSTLAGITAAVISAFPSESEAPAAESEQIQGRIRPSR